MTAGRQERDGVMPPTPSRLWRSAFAFVALVALAGLVLPASAWLVEAVAQRAENWILVLQIAIVVSVATAFRLRRSGPGRRPRELGFGIAVGVGATLIADLVWLVGMSG